MLAPMEAEAEVDSAAVPQALSHARSLSCLMQVFDLRLFSSWVAGASFLFIISTDGVWQEEREKGASE